MMAVPFDSRPVDQEFIRFAIEAGVLKFGSFITKAGRESPYFFNAGLFDHGGTLGSLAGFYAKTFLAAEFDGRIRVDSLFGPAYKGITLASAMAVALAQSGRDIGFSFNRKEAKTHGEGGSLVGSALKGNIMLVDDVITAGTAIRESMQIIQAQGANLAGVLIALDRQERGQGELSAIQEVERDFGTQVVSIIGLNDLINYLQGKPELAEHLAAVTAYRAEYGVSQ